MNKTYYQNTWGPPHPDDVDLVVGGVVLGRVRKVVERQPTIDEGRIGIVLEEVGGYNPCTKIWVPDESTVAIARQAAREGRGGTIDQILEKSDGSDS